VFILLEFPSPSRRIFIGSHSLPPSLVRRIGPSRWNVHHTRSSPLGVPLDDPLPILVVMGPVLVDDSHQRDNGNPSIYVRLDPVSPSSRPFPSKTSYHKLNRFVSDSMLVHII
jgi:hypothetical protein